MNKAIRRHKLLTVTIHMDYRSDGTLVSLGIQSEKKRPSTYIDLSGYIDSSLSDIKSHCEKSLTSLIKKINK